jgi:hypothetical protein
LIHFLFLDGLLPTGWKACATDIRAALVYSFPQSLMAFPDGLESLYYGRPRRIFVDSFPVR